MKNLLILTSLVITIFLSGCTSVKNAPDKIRNTFTFTPIDNSDTLYKANRTIEGKLRAVYPMVYQTMEAIKVEAKKRGYDYFQIVSPKSISNFDGFPINNTMDLMTYLNPNKSMPRHKLNFLESKKTLMDNENSQTAVNVPFTIFEDTTFDLVIRLVKEPMEDEIVWNVEPLKEKR